MRLTVVGCGPAEPQPDTGGSGLLVRDGVAAVLLDCGPGVVGRLRGWIDPRSLDAVVVGHLHADHYLDLIGLRYLLPWRGTTARLPVFLPPGGGNVLRGLAIAVSERPSFFTDAMDVREFVAGTELRLAGLSLVLSPARHYVPAWSMRVRGSSGATLAYTGDSGPDQRLLSVASGADLLVAEATLDDASEDDVERGHLTVAEAIALAVASEARHLLLTHFASVRRGCLEEHARSARVATSVARPGLSLTVEPGSVQVSGRDGEGHASEAWDSAGVVTAGAVRNAP